MCQGNVYLDTFLYQWDRSKQIKCLTGGIKTGSHPFVPPPELKKLPGGTFKKILTAPGAAAYAEHQPEPQMTSARPASDTKQEITWILRVTDTEHKVEDVYKLKSNLYTYLSDVSMGREEFIVLSPSEPVGGVSCVQVAREKEGFYFHVEAVLTEKGANGRAKIMCKDRALTVDSQNILVTFYQEHKVDVSGWSELGW